MPYLTVNDTQLYYEDQGTGRPLLFLHGWGTSGRVWGAQQADLVREFRVVTLDWRGCGRSARPLSGNTLAGAVADVAEVIRQLNLVRPVVIGSSIGATFATELALAHPELVAGVIAVDGPAYWPGQGMPLAEIIDEMRYRRAEFLSTWVPNWYAPGTAPLLVDWTIRQILDSGVYIDELFHVFATYDPRPRLPLLRTPIHYVHGELDAEIPVEVARVCAALTPGAQVSVIEGAGHMPQQERAAEFDAALRAAVTGFLLPTPA
ncbi:alpha/beta hydrolase family protein [Nocardia nova SH22a]|uniref:Alpha/beta hydrolase family protein n=1 Tax=Nocardia nova SH22a TaxID=1415166 RepID=W5TDQ6_9NOCA|nr:alpha/beta hydrolase [Nocardia nova]AHH15356.1 alpha/beta hydrolase family protein [Nocardia nova SH22a]